MKQRKEKRPITENLPGEFAFDKCVPTEDDFRRIATYWDRCRARQAGKQISLAMYEPPKKLVDFTKNNRYRQIRYMVVAAILGYEEQVKAFQAYLTSCYSKDDMQTILHFVMAHSFEFDQYISTYKSALENEKKEESLQEANSNLSLGEKMDLWHANMRKFNYKACGNDKLKASYDLCLTKGYILEANTLKIEGVNRELDWAYQAPSLHPLTSMADANNMVASIQAEDFSLTDAIYLRTYAHQPADLAKKFILGNRLWFKSSIIALMMAMQLCDKATIIWLKNAILSANRVTSPGVLAEYIKSLCDDRQILEKLADISNTLNVGTSPSNESLDENIEKHDVLNPKLWSEDQKLKPEVEEKINMMVDEFINTLEKDDIKIKVKDIVLIGSNCSYNYTENSDLDIHIIAETKSLKCPDELYPALYSAYRKLFEKKFDVEFYGIPVELYVETEGIPTVSNGCYSVKNGKWVKEPELKEIPDLDQKAFEEEFAKWESKYNDLLASLSITSDSLEESLQNDDVDKIKQFTDELYDLRKTGLAKDGEYGIGNLVFKEFRNKGYLNTLKELKNKAISKELSLTDDSETTKLEEALDDGQIQEYRRKLSKICGEQVFVDSNGMIEVYNIPEIDVNRVLTQLRQLPEVEYAQKNGGKFDYSRPDPQMMEPKRIYNVYGKIRLGQAERR